jgi:PPOX class probable FMN-dependent enzyme
VPRYPLASIKPLARSRQTRENTVNSDYIITREEQLTEILGEPSDLVKNKLGRSLNDAMKEFIGRSPLVFYSTIDSHGLVDVSPKGDAPGFVHIDEQGNLLIPDRPGNKLAYGYRNLLANPAIGLIFVVPTMTETLRVKGTAVISCDPELLEQLGARGKPATLCAQVKVKECFFHCGKAMIRSDVWKPEHWTVYSDSLLAKGLASQIAADEITTEVVEAALDESYARHLY